MPCCKNCGARISKLDKDMCPVCGCKNPLEGVTSETVDITQAIPSLDEFKKSYKPCKRNVAFLFSLLIGFTGAAFFYLRYIKIAIIHLIVNVTFIVVLFLILYFAAHVGTLLSILLPILISYLYNLAVGVYFLAKNNFLDGRGEIVK